MYNFYFSDLCILLAHQKAYFMVVSLKPLCLIPLKTEMKVQSLKQTLFLKIIRGSVDPLSWLKNLSQSLIQVLLLFVSLQLSYVQVHWLFVWQLVLGSLNAPHPTNNLLLIFSLSYKALIFVVPDFMFFCSELFTASFAVLAMMWYFELYLCFF